MTKSETITKLAAALAKAQGEMPVANFDATNQFLKNKYATLGAVIQTSRPILAKHNLGLIQFPISGCSVTGNGSVDQVGVESILTHESGEFISEKILIPLTEEKGKSRVQSAGSTLTYLRRYAWASVLGMYADLDTDGSSAAQVFLPKPVAALPPPPVQRSKQPTKIN